MIDHPSPLVEGDRLKIECRLSRTGSPYLFWIKGDGTVQRLTPVPRPGEGRIDLIEINEEELEVGDQAATEYFALIVAPDPVPGFTVRGWENELSIFRPLGSLGGDTLLIDGQPAGPEPRPEPHPGIARALKALPGRIDPRSATVSTLALPHEGRSP